mgnify:CR=1 FL=1
MYAITIVIHALGQKGMTMKDTFELTIDNPLTEEQFDRVTDVDLERTDRIFITTKHGKEIEFAKIIRCKDCKHWLPHEQFGFDYDNGEYHNYCAMLVPEDDDYYAFTREADEFCSRAERKDNG